MCHYKHWYFNDEGYVVQCERCNHFQVSFGTTMLTLDAANYHTLVKMVAGRRNNHVSVNDIDAKCVVLPTPCSSIHTVLSQKELFQLHDMLQEADTEMKTQELLNLFNAV